MPERSNPLGYRRFFTKILNPSVFRTLMLHVLMFGMLSANAGFLLQKLSLRFRNAPLEQVLKTLQKRSGHQFIYNNELIKKANPVTIDIENGTLEDILKLTFQNQPLTYEIIEQAIVVKPKASTAAKTVERTEKVTTPQAAANISGIVVDDKNEPLIGVSILIKGTQSGTTTDIDGRFSINSTSSNPVLVISFVGFITQEVEAGAKTNLNIILQPDNRTLDELVVVGYGTQKKVNLTGAVQNVKGEDLVKRNATNTSNALQGLVPGVSVTQSSGRTGADGASIRIRGTGSINSNASPLVLIDGVEGDMNNIDMTSIASISVLKDAASASIYGSRASNGVILITTKRADKGALKINYSGFAGVNTPTSMPEPLSAIEYMEAINVARANSNLSPQYSEELINKYKTEGADGLERYDTDWRKEVIRNNAFMQNHSVSMAAGTEKFRFFGNVGAFTQDGSIANNNYRRLTMRLNTDAQINKWLKIGTDVNLRSSKSKRPAFDSPEGIINKATTFVPVFSGINPDGTWGYGQNGDNPIAVSRAAGTQNETTPEMILKGFANITPLEGLDFLASYSVRRLETKSGYFINPYRTYENGVFKTTYPSGGTEKQEAWSQLITKQFNLQGSYEKQLGDHYVKLLSGIQTEDKASRAFSASRKGFNFPGFEDLNHGDVATSLANGSHWDWGIFSQFNRINYNFKEKYLLELTGRWDASSRFKKEYRWGFFPSASVGWRLSEENFFAPAKGVVNDLKFRASYGTLGNQDIANGYFPYAATIAPGSGYWFDKLLSTSAVQTQVANEKISWEKSTQLNFGLDAEILNSQLVMSLDYYIRNINDMLQQFPIPAYVGLGSPWENAGSMRNRGWDLSMTWRDRVGDVKYSITANVSDVRNQITNLYGKEYVSEKITREGDPIDSWYGYVAQGYFQNQSEIDNSAVYGERQNVRPGYLKYQDISGPEGKPDGVINAFDRTIIGNPAPRYEYSLNLNAEWKGFDFTMFFQGVGKRDIFYSGSGARPFYVGRSMFRHQLDYWTESNRDAAFPLLLIDGSGSNPNNIVSSFWVKSGAYARLKNVVLGYSLPASVLQKVKLGKARFYVSGQNLFTISNAYKGYDPENSVTGGSFYPVMRSLTAGLDIQF